MKSKLPYEKQFNTNNIHNEQQYQKLNIQRKTTIKKYTDPYNFIIYQNGDKLFKISISATLTINQLIGQVKKKLGQNQKQFIGLFSIDGNQIIDYTLKMKNFQLSNYKNNMAFAIQRGQTIYNEKQPSLNDFDFLKVLGSGVSASVYLVRHKSNGILYALKQINKNYFRDFKRMEQVLRQRKIMIQMIKDIPFTTKLIASFQSQKFLNLLLQYYPGGQMFVHLQRRRLSEQQAKLYVAEMILTFQKLHQRKIIYRDLKPENIMIDFNGHSRLGDYGLCKINLQYYDLTYSYCGSQEYMAPEVRTQNGYNYSVDFYTLGSFAYELVNGVPPYYNNQPLFFHQSSTDQFIELVQRLIENNMHKRLKSFTQIKRMKWFKHIDFKKVLEKKYNMPFRIDISLNYIGQEFKNQQIDPQAQEDKKFDKLLECFFYLSDDQMGIKQFYNFIKEKDKKIINQENITQRQKFLTKRQKDKRQFKPQKQIQNPLQKQKQTLKFTKIKRKNPQNLQTDSYLKNRKSSKSIKSIQRPLKSKSKSHTSSKSKEKNLFKKNTSSIPNIYTSIQNFPIKAKKSKKLNNSNYSSSKSHSKNKDIKNQFFQIQKGVIKKSINLKSKQAQNNLGTQKIVINKVKNSYKPLSTTLNTSQKVLQLQHVSSANQFKSPERSNKRL